MAAPDDSHLWLRGASAFGFTHYVAAVSNLQWPVASFRPQVAVCGFFSGLAEAAAFAAQHQRYKDEARTIPQGPIFLTLECGRLFPLSLSPRRLFGDQSAAAAKKRDAVIRNYYRRREAESLEVQRRKDAASEGGAAKDEPPIEPGAVDERTRRAVTRRARRQAWELLQRLNAQKDKLRRAAQFMEGGAAAGAAGAAEIDDELADFMEKLTPAQRQSIAEAHANEAAKKEGRAGDGGGGDAAAAVTAVAPTMDINPTPNTRMGTIDEYLAWAEAHFAREGIIPASNEMMDAEEREAELAEMRKIAGGSAPAASASASPPSSPSPASPLPAPPSGQAFCVGAIYYDDAGARLNRDCEQAQGREHVVTFMSAHETADAAQKALEAAYAPALKQETLFFVRTGVWCCFDHVADDDGVHMYREELMGDMLGKGTENQMLQFVDKALEQRPDMLPIPTARA